MRQIIAVVAALLAGIAASVSTAHAQWKPESGVFRIGVVADPSSISRYEPFRLAVEETLAVPVRVLVFPDASKLIDAQTTRRVDYAVLSSLGYAAADAMCQCLIPLVAPMSAEGATGIRSVLVADESFLEGGLADQKDDQVVGVGPVGSLTGDIIPARAFEHDGQSLSEAAFSTSLVESFEMARDRFLAGELAAVFAWDFASGQDDQTFRNGLAQQLLEWAQLPVEAVWISPMVPFGPHTVHQSVPEETRSKLSELLTGLDETAPDAYDAISPTLSGGFKLAMADDYRFTKSLVGALDAN